MDSAIKVSEMLSEVSEGFSAPTDKKEKVSDRLARLGFKSAATKIKTLTEKKRKLAIAYEHFRFVTAEKMAAFQEKLRRESREAFSGRSRWKELAFTPLDRYAETPPATVLDSLEKAIDRKCFDSFAVAHIVNVEDPILFGYIHGCTDHFFIDQWDDDVKIQDILKDNEG